MLNGLLKKCQKLAGIEGNIGTVTTSKKSGVIHNRSGSQIHSFTGWGQV